MVFQVFDEMVPPSTWETWIVFQVFGLAWPKANCCGSWGSSLSFHLITLLPEKVLQNAEAIVREIQELVLFMAL